MTFKTPSFIRLFTATAVLYGIAVVSVLCTPAFAQDPKQDILAAELLIVRGDLNRLDDGSSLPQAHVRGLTDRVTGALGLLPWLLRQANDLDGATQLQAATGTGLINTLDQLIARHPLDTTPYVADRLTPTQRRDAMLIHDTYCSGCHDGAGQGDEDVELPARDLSFMAREGPPVTFLARLINGVKGDETLLFSNPLTQAQITALWRYYQNRSHSSPQPHEAAR